MSSSILNHFKRVRSNDGSEMSSKRQKHEETDRSSTDGLQQPHGISTKFVIPPPDFDIDYSGSSGRIINKNPDLDLVLFKPFLSKSSAKALYGYLLSSLPWYKV